MEARITLAKLCTILLLSAILVTCSADVDLYVSAEYGNDAWSGRFPNPNVDRTDGPMATLQHAQLAVLHIPKSEPITVNVRSGVYFLAFSLIFTSADSGGLFPIVWCAYPDESPIISGGIQIKDFTSTPTGEWSAFVKSEQYFKQLHVDDERRPRARLPSLDGFYHYTAALPGNMSKLGFVYEQNDITDFHNIDDVNVVVYFAWTNARQHIKTFNPVAHTVEFTQPSDWPADQWFTGNRSRYFVDNAREGLDEPGEWYYDRTTQELLYKPMPGEEMNNVSVVASVLTELLVINGAKNLHFVGLDFRNQDWTCDYNDYCDGQSASFQQTAAVHVLNSTDITFSQCNVSAVGSYAVWIESGSSQVTWDGGQISDLGTGGVRIGANLCANAATSVVLNNTYILHGGSVFPSGCGVLLQHASQSSITHNEIGDMGYTGVSIGWDWGYDDQACADHNTVAYNRIYDIGRFQLSDMGGIYSLGQSPGTTVHHNVVSQVYTYDYGGWCLYPDQASSNMTWHDNVCYNTSSASFHQHWGAQNVIQNNVFAFGGQTQPDGSIRTEPDVGMMNTFLFENNIVYHTNNTLFYGMWTESASPLRRYTFESNLYFTPDNAPMVFPDGDFAQWQASGKDAGSLFGYDPQFVDAVGGDFTVREDSPAFKIGFKNIDCSQVGPQ